MLSGHQNPSNPLSRSRLGCESTEVKVGTLADFKTCVSQMSADCRRDTFTLRRSMRTIQWHLKNHWHMPETRDKYITVLGYSNVFPGQPMHLLQHAVLFSTDTTNQTSSHLEDCTAKRLLASSTK